MDEAEYLTDFDETELSTSASLEQCRKKVRLENPTTLNVQSGRMLCEHCKAFLSVKAYRRHYKLYFNQDTRAWITATDVEQRSGQYSGVPLADEEDPPELPLESDVEQVYDSDEGDFDDRLTLDSHCSDDSSDDSIPEMEDSEEMWEDQDESGCLGDEFVEDPPAFPDTSTSTHHASSNTMVTWLLSFLMVLQARHYIPDIAINALLKFLHVFFVVLGRFSHFCASIASAFPSSVFQVRKHLKQPGNAINYVVCPKCHRLYRFEECVRLSGPECDSKVTCTYVQFPNHPQCRYRNPCEHLLVRNVRFRSGRRILYPFKAFPYKPVTQSLTELLLRPGFADLCQQWKYRTISSDLLDVYDGQVWKDFQVVAGQPFLSSSLGLGLMMNIDWFQPYKHTTYTVGAIYITIMNLPRALRFKRENVILVGMLPGPSEPKRDINPYLEPLVDELAQLWTGNTMQVCWETGVTDQFVRCALLCVACDIPAGRKVCGFLGHSAKLGCCRCLKAFPGTVGAIDYSGFDRSKWTPRTNSGHRNSVEEVLQSTTKTQQAERESKLGCRYSCLLKLPYFDAPRMLTIDPMHNLFLGTGKHMLNIWLTRGIIVPVQFSLLQEYVDGMVVPSDIGRIPYKIATGFSGFTADQLKNWITLFSIPTLHGILTNQHLECWRHFVLACRILCKRALSPTDISLIDALLLQFCKRVETLYGKSAITPNMHLHGHMREVLNDFGPVYGFWLFSYERYNGILGNQPNNNRAVEAQLMNRFTRDNFAYSSTLILPSEFREEFSPMLHTATADRSVGSVGATLCDSHEEAFVTLPSSCSRGTLDAIDKDFVVSLYRRLHPDSPSDIVVNSICLKYAFLSLRGKTYGLYKSSRKSTHFVALAEWDKAIFGDPLTPLTNALHPASIFRPVRIHHFLKLSVSVQHNVDHLLVAVVSWYLPHPQQYIMGKPAQVWQYSKFECGGIYSFLPLTYLKCRCAFREDTIENHSVLVVVPLVE